MSDGDFQNPNSEGFIPVDVSNSYLYNPFITVGVSLINHERGDQLIKHGITIKQDYELNADYQLVEGAIKLLKGGYHPAPEGWDINVWEKMLDKSEQEKLIIAGALVAAEIDRLNYKE